MRDVKLVIFDLDGTLADAYTSIARSTNFVLRALGYPDQDPANIRRSVGWGDRNLMSFFVQDKDAGKALSLYRRHHAMALRKHSKLMPGARPILDYLKKKGYKLALATNRPTRFSHILLRQLGIRSYFSCVLCADKIKRPKPDPEILRLVMARLGVPAAKTLYVGDMAIDALTGRRAHVKTVIVTTGSDTRAAIRKAKPFSIIRGIGSLAGIL